MKRTGELLRTARENAKLSLSEVALSTKINPKVLAAIENGDNSNLPAKTFLKGFVRSYAMFLKMDADEVMKTFHSEMSGTPPSQAATPAPAAEPARSEPAPAAAPAPAPKQRRVGTDENFSGLRAVAVTVIVVLIGLIIGVRELIEKYQREKVVETSAEVKVSPLPETAPAPKADAKVEEKSTEPPKALAEAKTEAAPKEEPAPAPAPAPAAVVVPPPVQSASGSNPMVAAHPAPAPAPTPAPAVAAKAETPAAADPAKPQPSVRSAKNEIILEALDKVEVKFKIRGQTKVLSLGPTQVHTIFADEAIMLDFSDGGAVNIILNGRERGVPGDLGKPKQVSIP